MKLSKNKGFSNTSAQRYSLALYELSSESNSLDNIEQNSLAILNLINSSSDFNSFIKDPTENQTNLITFLIKKRRFFYLEKILKSFIETCSNKRGEVKAEIQSAKELSSDEIKKITEELTQNFSSKINYNKSKIE